MEALGVTVDVVPDEYRAEAILTALADQGELKGQRILIPRAKEAREILPEELVKRGAAVTVATTYVTIRPDDKKEAVRKMFADGKIDVVTFTSSSTVRNFIGMWESADEARALMNRVMVASIGPITSDTARSFGLDPKVEPSDFTTAALADALVDHFGQG